MSADVWKGLDTVYGVIEKRTKGVKQEDKMRQTYSFFHAIPNLWENTGQTIMKISTSAVLVLQKEVDYVIGGSSG